MARRRFDSVLQTLPPLIILSVIFFFFIKQALSQNLPAIAKPGCAAACGGVSIPYPFGTTENCHYPHRSFKVICNETFSPPQLFLLNMPIVNINLDGELTVKKLIGHVCYHRNGSRASILETRTTLPDAHLTISNTANTVTIVGCDAIGIVSGQRLGRSYLTGCMTTCYTREDLMEGSCTGSGCCQTSIPQNVRNMDIDLGSFSNYVNVSDFNDCGYAFVAEQNAFNFSYQSLTDLKNVTRLPMVIDWAMENLTCADAAKTGTGNVTYACLSSNSACVEPIHGNGYRCSCLEGYQGNPYLVDGCSDIDECKDPVLMKKMCGNYECVNNEGGFECPCPKGYRGDGKTGGEGCRRGESLILRIVAGSALGVIVLLLSACVLYLELKRRRSNKAKEEYFHRNGGVMLLEKLDRRERSPDMVKIFTSTELQKATNDFNNDMIIGQGGFGTVYKGLLHDNTTVAIKKSKRVDPNQTEQFINEVLVLSQINHRNVVRLLGCCFETEVPLLVYEFVDNGTLSSHVHNQDKARYLNWETRLRIAAETASVLSYLHSAAATPIIHRDVKSDNILLDHTFTAKVADFGASRLVPIDHTQLSTMVQGTFGYLDPEYMQTNQLTEKSDVYSFGVVLLELLTGRGAISFDKPEVEKNLSYFFLSLLKQDRILEVVDDSIVGDNYEQIMEVAKLAKGCLNVKGEDRPSMKEVAMELEGLRLGGKHAWARSGEDGEETESLLRDRLNEFVVNGGGDGGYSTSTAVGYDSIRDQVVLPILGGGR
ncbi:hypothetical protein ABFS82_03G114700 [Erythranthe guttata]|uniref:wall-associated receptor kinase 2-like isoform X1 n=1 Tax=Erythranthe guttata TaxID=4155 RepID=UPI00064DC929|nr:PREDICTED: wall-associated receptor kinase 2-like isoform X1 [Erythranthe guttata]|eukprot:XP_012854912.1 PREDICTED: wall-associated receptor kinase 2-like isoform X1 [Erythranthe guttata]